MGIARYEKRLLAYLFDEVVSCAFGVGIAILMVYYSVLDDSAFPIFVLSAVFAYGVYVVLCTISMILSGGATLGSLVFGIKAVHPDGEKFTLRDALIRAFGKGLVPAVGLNAIYMLCVHSQRSAFDRLSGTIVVDVRKR